MRRVGANFVGDSRDRNLRAAGGDTKLKIDLGCDAALERNAGQVRGSESLFGSGDVVAGADRESADGEVALHVGLRHTLQGGQGAAEGDGDARHGRAALIDNMPVNAGGVRSLAQQGR